MEIVKANSEAEIFVSIASYRDPECQYTVRDLFLKAAHPERIRVGICWQFDAEHDQDCFLVPSPYPRQVRQLRYPVHESKGGCWARAQALSLRQDEAYVLQIDAHMRFAPEWDNTMIDTLQRCHSERPTLSTLTFNYNPPDRLQDTEGGVTNTYAYAIGGPEDMQPLHLRGYNRQLKHLPKYPIRSAFFVGNFFFAPALVFKEVPFDPHLYFRGQELTYSARLWTHGWDIYQPDSAVIYHYWGSKTRDDGAAHHYKRTNDKALLAQQRLRHILEFMPADNPAALVEIEKYGMGTVRSLEDYWTFAGIDLRNGTIAEHAKQGFWPKPR